MLYFTPFHKQGNLFWMENASFEAKCQMPDDFSDDDDDDDNDYNDDDDDNDDYNDDDDDD